MVNVFNYFPTIQGEGRSIGKGVFLIRTWGCNYTCKWCDISEVSQCRSKYKKLKLTNNEYHELLNSIEKALSRYSIDILLITGGEPTIYFTPENRELWNQIASYFKHIEIETNGSNPSPYFSYSSPHEYFYTFTGTIKFNVSPKLNIDAYSKFPYIRKIEDIVDFYKYHVNRLLLYHKITEYHGVTFKFVYKKEYGDDILYFIDALKIPRNIVSILPYTPVEYMKDGELNFYHKFKEYRLETVEFCLKNGLRYTPREHIELYFLKTNEHADCK